MVTEARLFVTLMSSMMLLIADLDNEAIGSDTIDGILVVVNVVAMPVVLVLNIARCSAARRRARTAHRRFASLAPSTSVEIERGEATMNPISDVAITADNKKKKIFRFTTLPE